MNTIQDIADQLRACVLEHVRAVIEPDDTTTLVAYLEGMGFVSAAAAVSLDAEAMTGRGVYADYIKANKLTARQVREMNADDAAAHRAGYTKYLATPDGMKAVADATAAQVKADAEAVKAAQVAEDKVITAEIAAENKVIAANAAKSPSEAHQ